MRIKPNISLVLRLVSCSDPNLCFVNSSSCTETFGFALRNVVRLHCKVGDAGFWRHPKPQTQELCAEWTAQSYGLSGAVSPQSIIQKMQQDQHHPLSPAGTIAPWCSQAWCCLERGQYHCLWPPKLCQEPWSGLSPGNGALSPEQPSWWWIKPWHSSCAQTALEQGFGHTHEVHCVLSWNSNSGTAQGLSYQKLSWKMLKSSWKEKSGPKEAWAWGREEGG